MCRGQMAIPSTGLQVLNGFAIKTVDFTIMTSLDVVNAVVARGLRR